MKDSAKVYVARAGKHGEDEDLALEEGLAIIGFRDVPSLEGAAGYKAVAKFVDSALPDAKPKARINFSRQLSTFALTMREGDFVVLPRKLTSQIAIGRVTGPYGHISVHDEFRHTRPVAWSRPDVPRATFRQDLLYSFGSAMTVCNVSRNDAARRVATVFEGKPDPALSDKEKGIPVPTPDPIGTVSDSIDEVPDLAPLAHDQVMARIEARFKGHDMERLVNAVLQAEGWVTERSRLGPDGGVDILAGRGSLGLDAPWLCVQVKSQKTQADVTIYRALRGTMENFNAKQGLLVCWGGFNKVVVRESRQNHFIVRLWDDKALIDAIYRNYEQLPAEIQAELPLKRVWMLVPEDSAE